MENKKRFSRSEAIKFGWHTFKNNFAFWVAILAVYFFFSIFLQVGAEYIKMDFLPKLLLDVIIYVLSIIIAIGMIKIALKLHDNQKAEVSDLFSHYRLFFKYLLGSILYGLIVMAGLILFIVPGIIWSLKFYFFDYYIVDKNCGPVEALKKSALATKNQKWNLFVFIFLLLGINLIGAALLMVGLVVTIPLTLVATAFVYRKLSSQIEEITS